jgi:hypothetical protein
MPCYQRANFPPGLPITGRTGYKSETECVEACQEGACCEGAVCTVKPRCLCLDAGQVFKGFGTTCNSISGACCEGTTCSIKTECECQGAGKEFKGVGTVCTPNPCLYGCGGCNSIPAELTATITSSGGDYLNDVGCVVGNASLTLSRPNVIQAAAPSGCWNSSIGAGCDVAEKSDYWTSGIGPGGLMFRVIGQCVQQTGARIMSQMYATCSGSQIVFGFSCGKTRATAAGCPDAYDCIGNRFPFTTVFDYVQLGLTLTSCSPFLATGTRAVNGVTLTVTLTANPLP